MRYKNIFVYIFGVLILSSCASVSYIEPQNGPIATITVKASENTINNPVFLHSEQCTDKDAELVGMLNSRAVGMPKGLKELTFKVKANEKLSISMMAGEMDISPDYLGLKIEMSGCRRIVDFIPKENESYELTFIHAGKACFYPVYEIQNDGSKHLEDSAKVRENCSLPNSWSP